MLTREMVEELRSEVLYELNEGPFAGRLHYSKRTYYEGCRGPMCTKAERDSTKERQERKYRKSGLPYRPQTDSVETCIRDDFLNVMIQRHREWKGFPKMPRPPVYPADYFEEPTG